MDVLIGTLIQLLVLVLILVIIVWVAQLIINALGLPAVALTIVQAIAGLILLLWLLSVLMGHLPPGTLWRRG